MLFAEFCQLALALVEIFVTTVRARKEGQVADLADAMSDDVAPPKLLAQRRKLAIVRLELVKFVSDVGKALYDCSPSPSPLPSPSPSPSPSQVRRYTTASCSTRTRAFSSAARSSQRCYRRTRTCSRYSSERRRGRQAPVFRRVGLLARSSELVGLA